MYDIIIGVSISASIGVFLGFIFVSSLIAYHRDHDESKDYPPIEKLKNALLTLALIKINKNDMADLDLNYDTYNGSKYPALSGCSLENACFSYIFNEKHFKKSGLYSNYYASKMCAINKYLKMNLDTEQQVTEFFHKFCEKYKDQDTQDNKMPE